MASIAGRFNRDLQKFFDLKGDPPAPDLAGEIMPVIDVESILEHPERAYLQGVKLMAVGALQTALAGNASCFRFVNPATSGVIAVFYFLTVTCNLAARVHIARHATLTALASGVSPIALDSRFGILGASAITVTRDNVTGSTATVDRFELPANDAMILPHQIVLAPGSAWDIYTATNNLDFLITARWIERAVERSEL